LPPFTSAARRHCYASASFRPPSVRSGDYSHGACRKRSAMCARAREPRPSPGHGNAAAHLSDMPRTATLISFFLLLLLSFFLFASPL